MITDAKRLIGRRFTDETVQKDIKFWPFKVLRCPHKDDKPSILVTFKGQEKLFAPEQISSMILSKMKQTAESYLNSEVKSAVVTVPAYFNDSQRRATKDAATLAGLEVLRIINEPTAAAIAYGLEKKVVDSKTAVRKVLVFDLGGGTFDVSVVVVGTGVFEVKAISGDTHLGGADFDNNLVNHFVEEFKAKHKRDINGNPRALGRLRAACERAKRTLSSTTQTFIEVDCLYDSIDFSSKITRAKFEELNRDLFTKCIVIVDKCLKDAKIKQRDVSDVVLVGGSTRIPKIQQLVQDFFNGKKLCKSLNADEAVAYGAAIHAANLSGVRHKEKVMLVDITPFSIGSEVSNGKMSVVIPRHTPIPTTKKKKYQTVTDYQTTIEVNVYEGERPEAKDNHFLGKLTLSGITPARKGITKVIDCYKIDDDGILTVTSTDEKTGKNNHITITNHSGRLSLAEINAMLEEAIKYRNEDKELQKVARAKSNLENYLTTTRDTVCGTSGGVLRTSDKIKLEYAIDQTFQWLDRNADLEASKFEEKLNEIKSVCDPVIEEMQKMREPCFED